MMRDGNNTWKIRFADAVIEYTRWYKRLIELTKNDRKDNGDKSFLYEESFVGLLYKELEIYVENPSIANIIGALQPSMVLVVTNPSATPNSNQA